MKKNSPKQKTKTKARAGNLKAVSPKASVISLSAPVYGVAADRPKTSRLLSNSAMLNLSKGINLRTSKFSSLKYALGSVKNWQERVNNTQQKAPDMFTRFAQTPFERAAAWFYNQYPQTRIDPYEDQAKAENLFRSYYCPMYAAIAIGWFTKTNNGTPPLWMITPASYLIAMERTHFEMVLSVTKSENNTFNGSTWGKPIRVPDFARLPKPNTEWFLNPPGDHKLWQSRFEIWRQAALASFRYWMSNQCRDTTELPPALAGAAMAGAIVHESPFPPGFMDDLINHFQTLHKDALKIFYSNASEPMRLSHGDVEIDTWLIEIWPLAVEQKWNYQKISELAGKRFDRNAKGAALDRSGIEARCEKLELRLHVSQRKGGRPSLSSSADKQNELMAIWIESIGIKKSAWLAGQRNLSGKK